MPSSNRDLNAKDVVMIDSEHELDEVEGEAGTRGSFASLSAGRATGVVTRKRRAPFSASSSDAAAAKPVAKQQKTETQRESIRKFFQKKKVAPSSSTVGTEATVQIPEGDPNCLHGLKIVFTGDPPGLPRSDAESLAKRYGAKVTSAVSGVTDYLVIGDEPGITKTQKARQLGTKTLDLEGFLELIRKREGTSDEVVVKEIEKREEVKKKALEREFRRVAGTTQENEPASSRVAGSSRSSSSPHQTASSPSKSSLWVDKYRPTTLAEIIGNKTQVQTLCKFLTGFKANLNAGFPKGGYQSISHFRAALLSGPPGIGKTTAAHVAAKSCGYDVIEFNASSFRSKKLLDETLKPVLQSHTIVDFFKRPASGGPGPAAGGSKKLGKTLVIMDEVDGMDGNGDRGGVAELYQLIKTTRIPVICICNDGSNQKLKTLKMACLDLPFRRPDIATIRDRAVMICKKEQLSVSPTAVDRIVEASGRDLRQVLNTLNFYNKKGSTGLGQEAGRQLAEQSGKNLTIGLWDASRILLSQSEFKGRSIGDRTDLYFSDYDFVPLMVQENYLRVSPRSATGPQAKLNELKALSDAADSISQGDMVNDLIRRDGNWSLMPAHALLSSILPGHYMSGHIEERLAFTSFLGNLSKGGKLSRKLATFSSHLRLRNSATNTSVRQDYIPSMICMCNHMLHTNGRTSEVSDILDSYFLSKEELDDLWEYGIGPLGADKTIQKLDKTTKASLTRTYNRSYHPMAFAGLDDKGKPIGVIQTKGPKGRISMRRESTNKAIEAIAEMPADVEEALALDASKMTGAMSSEDEDVITEKQERAVARLRNSRMVQFEEGKAAVKGSPSARGRGRGRGRGRASSGASRSASAASSSSSSSKARAKAKAGK